MANLIKELKSVAVESRKDSIKTSAVTEAQRLIADKGAEDMSILQGLGMHHSVAKAIDLHGRRIELENLEKEYGDVFSAQDIKNVACRYALKFLRSDKYKGAIDPVMIQKLREFFVSRGMEVNQAKLGYDFFVLAPPSAFHLVDRPKPQPIDPILFYRLDDNHYKLIHKWGADLTPLRRLIGAYKSHIYIRWIGLAMLYLLLPVFFGTLYHFDNTVYSAKECSGWQVLMWIFILAPIGVWLIALVASWDAEDVIPFKNFKPWSETYTSNFKD